MKRTAVETWTHKVEEALRLADDFRSAKELCLATGANICQVSAALCHLQQHRVVEAVQGQKPSAPALWFHRGSGHDTRTHAVETRTPEIKPRRLRRARVAP